MMVVSRTSTTREPGCIGGGGGTAGGGAGGVDGDGTNDSNSLTLPTDTFCCARDAKEAQVEGGAVRMSDARATSIACAVCKALAEGA